MKKDLTKISTEKLSEMYQNESAENQELIVAELERRHDAQEEAAEAEKVAEVSEVSGGKKTDAKMSADEADKAYEECLKNKCHKCQVFSMDTLDWQDGYIAGVIYDKVRARITYRIKLDEGGYTTKSFSNEKHLRISDEIVSVASARAEARSKAEPWNDDEAREQVLAAKQKVGFTVTVKMGDEIIDGRIKGTMIDRRVDKVFYHIALADGRMVHKVVTSELITISEEMDDEGKAMNEKALKVQASKEPTDPIALRAALMNKVEKFTEQLEKLTEKLAIAKQQLAELVESAENEGAENGALPTNEVTENEESLE